MNHFIRLTLILSCMMFLGSQISGQASSDIRKPTLAVSPSFRIYPGATVQTEPIIAVHPSDPNVLFVTANTFHPSSTFQSEGIYVSTNGGVNWVGNDTCTGLLINAHFGNPGIAIDKNGRFFLSRRGTSPGLYAHYSLNNGSTWPGFKTITTEELYKAVLLSNTIPESEYYGRTFAVWTTYGTLEHPVNISYTNDGGVSWSAPAKINNPATGTIGLGGETVVMTNGDLAVCWARAYDVSPFIEDFVGFALSSDGGITWTRTEHAFDMNGITGRITEKGNLKTNSLPRIAVDRSGGERNDWLYIVTAQKNLLPAGNDPDIILNRSTDSGKTWSAGIRVNQDVLNNGKNQYFPAVHVDAWGAVNVLFYDDRNTSVDSIDVVLARSTDGGETWTEFEISDHSFQPKSIPGLAVGYQGDNISLTSTGNTLHAFWMDNSSGVYQIWTCQIDVQLLSVGNKNSTPQKFLLNQNYPNPFNPVTTIKYSIPVKSFVTIDVFDILGNYVSTIVHEIKPVGEHEIRWDATNYPSGIYLYRLTAGDFTELKKLVLIR